ncbi:VWA domain-containing protein [Haliea sp. E17]|uniref:VWA domain-containing protein n=1 Tax=Haliea sp. E17 TaxID=3401576 RepID=UPI003AAE1FF4
MSNLAIAQPWWLLCLPLPLLVWWLVPPHRVRRGGLQVPFLPRLAAAAGSAPGSGAVVARSGLWRLLVVCFCWCCAVLALARPQLVEPPVSKEIPVRDMLLAVDLSGSMETRDFTDAQGRQVDRLTAVKEVLDDFLARRQGDRVGLILFGSAAFVQAPFTEDLDVVRQLLDEAQVRMAGPQTAFGDALGLAITVFERSTVRERVLIALTDGNDTASQVPPDKAAQIARDKGIVIHSVAVGDPRSAGEDALDEKTLQQVASATGGIYSHATDRSQLQAIYDQLDQLETRKVQTISHRPRRDVYWWPLAAALVVSMAYFAVGMLLRGLLLPGREKRLVEGVAGFSPALLGTALLAFHFVRPGWLLALLPAGLLWWRLRRIGQEERAWRGIVAPHLLRLLWRDASAGRRLGPLSWIGLCWLLAIVAIAGPSWKRMPSAFAEDTAPLAIVVKVTPSMLTEDIQPSRLQRATQKIHDLLAARGSAKSALIAYAGSAHLVMPATADAGIIDTFAAALDPALMPVEGDAAAEALQLADLALAQAGGGSILWIADAISPGAADALRRWRKASSSEVRLWPPLLRGTELDAVKSMGRAVRADTVQLAADDSDVAALATAARFAPVQAGDSDTRWAESGYWLTPLLALMLLVFFRRGWLVPLAGGRA